MTTPSSERRTVAVLFAEFPGLEEARTTEEARDAIDAVFRRFRAIVEGRGGTIDKFAGTMAMALLGAPAAHADGEPAGTPGRSPTPRHPASARVPRSASRRTPPP